MMKRLMSMFFALAFIFLSGCGAAQAQPGQNGGDASPSQNGGQTEPAELTESYELIDVSIYDRVWDLDPDALGTYELDFTSHDPPTSRKTRFFEEWIRLIKEATGGGVDITLHTSGTLAGAGDALTAVEMGTADIGWLIGSSFYTQFPITTMFGLAAMGLDSNTMTTEIMWDLYEETEAYRQEFSSVKMLLMYTSGHTGICSNVRVDTFDDLDSMKLRVLPGTGADILTRIGAAPISMGPGDIYDSMSKNILDGYCIDWTGITAFNLHEVTSYYTDNGFWTIPMLLVMNNDSFDQLPPEYREVIEYYSLRDMSMQKAYQWELEIIQSSSELATPDQFYSISDEAWEQVKSISRDYNEEIAEERTTPAFDGSEFLAKIYEATAQYEADGYQYYRFMN